MLWMIADTTRTPSIVTTVEQVARMAAAGTNKITIRNDGIFSLSELLTTAERIIAKCPGVDLFIAASPEDVRRCGAHGIHLRSSAQGRIAELRAAHPDLAVAVSTHTPAEFEQAFSDGVDYAFYAPVFPPYSKPHDTRPTVAPVKRRGLFLLGGLDRGRAEGLIRQGFYDLAAISLFYGKTAVEDVEYLSRLLNEVTDHDHDPT